MLAMLAPILQKVRSRAHSFGIDGTVWDVTRCWKIICGCETEKEITSETGIKRWEDSICKTLIPRKTCGSLRSLSCEMLLQKFIASFWLIYLIWFCQLHTIHWTHDFPAVTARWGIPSHLGSVATGMKSWRWGSAGKGVVTTVTRSDESDIYGFTMFHMCHIHIFHSPCIEDIAVGGCWTDPTKCRGWACAARWDQVFYAEALRFAGHSGRSQRILSCGTSTPSQPRDFQVSKFRSLWT